jgi:hypothetical protein
VQSLEGGLRINFGRKDWDIGEALSNGDGPNNNLLDAPSKHAGEEFFHFDATVD